MAYNEFLAERIEQLVNELPGIEGKKMFGGIGYLLNGNMSVGVYKEFLIVRSGPEKYEELLEKPHTKVFDITGKVMKGWIMVEEEGFVKDSDLASWINLGIEFAESLPKKK